MTPSPRSRRAPRKPRRAPRSYISLTDALAQPLTFADTELSEGLQRHSLVGLVRAALSRKRRADGEPLPSVLCALPVWPLLKAKSLHCFCAELCQFLAWRVHQANELGPRSPRAFVVDDTSQARAGRKVEGTSCYFDHTEGRHRHGHQVLQLGLAAERGFLPVEAQLVTGQKEAVDKPTHKPFRDQRSAAARDMRRAREQSKHRMCREMLQRALRAGLRAGYLLARGIVAWGEKPQKTDVVDVAALQMEQKLGFNNEIIYDRTRFVMHLNAMKWVGTPVGESPANAELGTVTNWNLVEATPNRVGAVCMRTNG